MRVSIFVRFVHFLKLVAFGILRFILSIKRRVYGKSTKHTSIDIDGDGESDIEIHIK